VQLFLLKTFSDKKNEQNINEIQQLLLDYYRKKTDEITDAFWNENNLDNNRMREIMYGHSRISTK
jgi:hypothetical protein